MSDIFVVGLGASAGGLQAIDVFFGQMPADAGLAYMIMLYPDHEQNEQLIQLLETVTSMAVQEVTEKRKVEVNTIYILPSDKHMIITEGWIDISPDVPTEDHRAPMDIFFRSLAEAYKSHVVGLIFSGTGANGSMGLKRIKEKGGTVFVQNPREAEYNEMPRNAIATELVDEVLNVADIPARIINYRGRLGKIHIPVEAEQRPDDQQQALREVFTQLRLRTGHDFSNYKRPTILRRIERRINILNLPDLPGYTAYIKDNPAEVNHLLKELLISVTNFFRDKAAFDMLEHEVITQLFEDKKSQDQVRIWVAGCATGEEAYSIAMLCAEQAFGNLDMPKVQIFATDIDEAAITHAREGFYTLNDAADVSPERLHRFFNKEVNGYRIRREIREMILFAYHNFIKDPPFSHLDLITCRNVLIYLNHSAQERVMETFHFALKPGKFLFLGNTESTDGAGDLYSVISRDQHIYKTRPVASRTFPVPDSLPSLRSESSPATRVPQENQAKVLDRITFGDLHQRMLEQYAPPSLITNEEYDILHVSEKAGQYLQVSGGELSPNLLKLIRPELRLDIRSALYQATQQHLPVTVRNMHVITTSGSEEIIHIHVRPVLRDGDMAKGYILIVFEPAALEEPHEKVVLRTRDEPVAKQLEDELIRLKIQLRNSNEQHEFQAEELRASNEELQAMNEELRSSAEELETGKEELQSINEELITVNQELKIKVEEVSVFSNNLQNLINATDIGTIFLDRSFRVVLFTPAAARIFNLISADYGRLLSDITNKLISSDIMQDAETVLSKLQTIEREVQTTDSRIFLMRVLPYRTMEDRINGVVICFVDITSRRKTEINFYKNHERLIQSLEALQAGWVDWNWLTGETTWSDEGKEIMGFASDEDASSIQGWLRSVHPDDRMEWEAHVAKAAEMHTNINSEYRVILSDGAIRYVLGTGSITYDLAGNPVSSTGLVIDITQRKHAEETLRKSEEHLRITLESAVDYAIITLDTSGIIEGWSQGAELIFGYTAAEAIGQPGYIVFTPEDIKAGVPEKEMQAARTTGRAINERWHMRRDGSRFYMSGIMRPILNPSLAGYVKVARDMTEQKKTSEQLRISEERYRIALQSADMAAWDWHLKEDRILWNDQHYILLGLPVPAEETPKDAAFFLQFVHPDDLPLVNKALERAIYKNGSYEMDAFRVIRTDGRVCWMSGYGRVVAWEGTISTRMVGVMFDITARVEAARALQDKQLKLEIAQRAARVGIWGYDLVKHQGIATPELIELTGYPVHGESWEQDIFLKLVYPEDRKSLIDAHNTAAEERTGVELEFRIMHPRRGVLWMLMRGSYIPPYDNMNASLMGSLIDITERKAFEQQKDEFIGIASHELKTPVTSIKAYAEILQEILMEAGDTESAALMAKLDVQVDRLTGLIHALLDTTRLTEGQLQLQQEVFSMDTLIIETAEIMQHTTSQHKLELRLEAGESSIFADRERIRQVLVNLIGNAIKYSPDQHKVIIASVVADKTVTVSIRDFGVGIEETMQAKIFERFFRASIPEIATFPGLGLGLFISAEIVRYHGGTIAVESRKGEGSLFYFTLPLAD